MSRYTGPKWRIARRENADVFGSDKWRKRSTPPGQFPVSRGRPSEYAKQLREKQKVKRMYGLTEKQMQNLYKTALKSTGNSGTRLLQLLELRVDNVLYKLGLAKNRVQARQYVTHGHVLLNGKKHNIPSTVMRSGDELRFVDKFAKRDAYKIQEQELKNVVVPEWLEQLKDGGKLNSEPLRDQIDPGIKERLIIEFYSR